MFVAFNVVLSSFQRTKVCFATSNRRSKFESVFYIIEDEPSKLNAKRQLTNPRFVFRYYP